MENWAGAHQDAAGDAGGTLVVRMTTTPTVRQRSTRFVGNEIYAGQVPVLGNRPKVLLRKSDEDVNLSHVGREGPRLISDLQDLRFRITKAGADAADCLASGDLTAAIPF